jgi:Flp pilus assembly pilin Flp
MKFEKIKKKIKEYIKNDCGGNLVEYSLLIGFALFIFFIMVTVITSMLGWMEDQSLTFLELINGIGE